VAVTDMWRKLSAIGHQPSAISHQPSAISSIGTLGC
jgi:hypothetical protein